MILERISRNSGNDDKYVVIAKSGNVALGVYLRLVGDHYRPKVDGKRPISITGRIRIAAAPGASASEVEINEAFKQLPIEKFANEAMMRSSFSLGFFLNQVDMGAVSGAFDEQKVGLKLYDFLTLYIGSDDMLVTAEELHEVIKAEIGGSIEEKSFDILSVAMDMAKQEPEFDQAISSVLAQLDKARQEASEVFKATGVVALSEATATAEVLMAEYLKAHPDFTSALPETDQSEFKLLSLLYASLDPTYDGTLPEESDQY
ncbi:hypothetical protein LCGC14_2696820, partial [marine sediment metagenome]